MADLTPELEAAIRATAYPAGFPPTDAAVLLAALDATRAQLAAATKALVRIRDRQEHARDGGPRLTD